jgi:hypothetical protein
MTGFTPVQPRRTAKRKAWLRAIRASLAVLGASADNLVTERGEVDDFGIFALEVLKRLHLSHP